MTFAPGLFVLGAATGVLGLVLLFSLIIAYAYDEPVLLALGAYLLLMALVLLVSRPTVLSLARLEGVLLVLGPALLGLLQVWVLRSRKISLLAKAVALAAVLGVLALAALRLLDSSRLTMIVSSCGLAALLALSWRVFCLPLWHQAGPWKWWLLTGHLAGTVAACLFLSGLVSSTSAYGALALMLVLQVPPTYLALVWRSRMLNESRLRGLAAKVTDPLTGLASLGVLMKRLPSAITRARQSPHGGALYLIDLHNMTELVEELGAEAREKILLEAANRIRRAVNDRDITARIAEHLFAVLAEDLQADGQVDALASKLVASGLRIDSQFLPGVALQFRVVASGLKESVPPDAASAQRWLRGLSAWFAAWPDSHRARSILLFTNGQMRRPQKAVPGP